VATGKDAKAVDDYIAGFPPSVQEALRTIRALVAEMVPDATETISYGIPTFDVGRTHLVHYAGYEHHIGIYPTPSAMDHFDAELARYQRGKGSVRIPLDEPLPIDLIRRIVEYRVAEIERRS
jgi:uncharacterized protein YdhG (YjbR/CyaY superfamily)